MAQSYKVPIDSVEEELWLGMGQARVFLFLDLLICFAAIVFIGTEVFQVY